MKGRRLQVFVSCKTSNVKLLERSWIFSLLKWKRLFYYKERRNVPNLNGFSTFQAKRVIFLILLAEIPTLVSTFYLVQVTLHNPNITSGLLLVQNITLICSQPTFLLFAFVFMHDYSISTWMKKTSLLIKWPSYQKPNAMSNVFINIISRME